MTVVIFLYLDWSSYNPYFEAMRTKRGVDARTNMISAAIKLFRSRGYEGVGVAELLAESGAPRGSLYFHFPGGKQQIAQEAVAQDAERVAALLARLRERNSGPEDYIAKIFTGWQRDLERANFELGCIVAMSAIELGPRSPEIAEAAKQAFSRWEGEVAAAARDWGMDDARAQRFSAAAIAAIEGALIMSRVRQNGDAFDLAAESLLSLAREYLRS
jgi:TetR/AcrR family transcriptional repressor of lmrAB and yxaGH operons